jgi:hypothetical protein
MTNERGGLGNYCHACVCVRVLQRSKPSSCSFSQAVPASNTFEQFGNYVQTSLSRIRHEALLRAMPTEEVVLVLLDTTHGNIRGGPLPWPVQVDRHGAHAAATTGEAADAGSYRRPPGPAGTGSNRHQPMEP